MRALEPLDWAPLIHGLLLPPVSLAIPASVRDLQRCLQAASYNAAEMPSMLLSGKCNASRGGIAVPFRQHHTKLQKCLPCCCQANARQAEAALQFLSGSIIRLCCQYRFVGCLRNLKGTMNCHCMHGTSISQWLCLMQPVLSPWVCIECSAQPDCHHATQKGASH